MAEIKAGTMADLMFEGSETGGVSSMETITYSVEGRRIVLSQPTPPLSEEHKGKRLLVTFIERKDGTQHRYGFWAELTDLPADYEITADNRVPALVLQKKTDPKIYNLRMAYRIQPAPNSGLSISIHGTEVNIIDISVNGARISSAILAPLKPHAVIHLILTVDGKRLEVEGMLIRVWSNTTVGSVGYLQFATIKFTDMQQEREYFLGRKILFLERQRLAHCNV